MDLTPWEEEERRAEEQEKLNEFIEQVPGAIAESKERMRYYKAVLSSVRAKVIPDSQLEMIRRTVEFARLGGTSRVLGEG